MNPVTHTNDMSISNLRPLRRAALLGLSASALVLSACHGEVEPLERPTPDPVAVTVSAATTSGTTTSVSGTVEADRLARISTRMSGTIRSVEVDVGDRVSAGTPLLRLDTSDLDAQLGAAEAEQRIATATWERVRALAADGAASRQELDELAARKDRADAMVAEVRAQYDYAVVRAPFDGLLETRMADPGDLAAPGQPLLTLVADGTPRVTFELPATFEGEIEAGDEVTVHRPETGWSGRAIITRVAPALDPVTRRRPVEAEFTEAPGAAVLPGAFVRVEVGTGQSSSLWIPADALVRRGQLTGVFSVESDTLRLRWVRLGRVTPSAVEVLAGPGEILRVVRTPANSLVDGAPVAQLREEAWSAQALPAEALLPDASSGAESTQAGGDR